LAFSEHTKTDKTPLGDLCNVADGLNIIFYFKLKKTATCNANGGF
jgi:hypothetical protein